MSKARGLADLGNVYNDGALSNRNLIINGAMQVAQRGTSFSSGGAIYTADRWEIYPGSNPGVVDTSRVQFNASDDMLVVSGFNYYLNTVYSTGVGGAAYDNRHFRINQENAYFYAGKTFTISFWAKSDTNRKLGLETRLNAGATEDTLYKSVLDASGWQLSTSWQYFTHTFTIPALVTTSASIEASVASFYITADPVSTGATYDITGVQLEVGDTATPFEHRSYGQELALCQRYYQYWDNLVMAFPIVSTDSTGRYLQIDMIKKRATPTISCTVSAGTFINRTTGPDTIRADITGVPTGGYTYAYDIAADAEL